MSRLRLHLTKQEAWKAVARLTLAEPVAQRHQSQTRPAFLRARCKSERLTLLDRLAVFLLPDAVAFTLATGRIVPHPEVGPNRCCGNWGGGVVGTRPDVVGYEGFFYWMSIVASGALS
jgi:hypothetical protein